MILFVWCRQQFPLFEVLVGFFIKRFTYPFCVIYHHCSQRLMTFEYYKDQKFYNYFRFSKIFIRRWYNGNNIGAWAILVYKKFDIVANVKCLDISCILTQTEASTFCLASMLPCLLLEPLNDCPLSFRILAFYRVPPVAGRRFNMTYEIKRLADRKLAKTFFISPGKCKKQWRKKKSFTKRNETKKKPCYSHLFNMKKKSKPNLLSLCTRIFQTIFF